MPVKVLIIDDVATNRIVLKVKLSAASYEVFQAESAREGVEIAARETPDIYVVAAELEGESSADLISRLTALPNPSPASIVVISETDCPSSRLQLMQAGAFDVLVKPLCDTLLQARLRSICRRRHKRQDLALTSDKADALGFDETPSVFAPRGRIRACDPGAEDLRTHLQTLAGRSSHDFGFYPSSARNDAPLSACAPDVVLVLIDGDAGKAGFTQLAEVPLADPTRHARLIGVLRDGSVTLAAKALDLGADDVVDIDAPPEEVDLRISTQVQGKRADDSLRRKVQTSLEAAVTDPLTGLYNRRYALSALERLRDTLLQDGGSFSVMVADLDHFKAVNDTYGHSAGDIALKRVAEQLHKTLDKGNIVSRFGGEEFLILLPESNAETALEIADQLRMTVRQTDIVLPDLDSPVHVTISIGVTVAHGARNTPQKTVQALLREADQALYASKSNGRDTVRFNRSSAA